MIILIKYIIIFRSILAPKLLSFKILNFDIDFSKLDKNDKLRILYLNIRKESFLNTIYSKLPWEDLVIGFQCKILRSPNIYNVNFWHHFTNKYVTSKRIRIASKNVIHVLL